MSTVQVSAAQESENTYLKFRQSVFGVLNPALNQTALERAGHLAISVLILMNVAAVILESVPSFHSRFALAFAMSFRADSASGMIQPA
jgi:hypothetical protein